MSLRYYHIDVGSQWGHPYRCLCDTILGAPSRSYKSPPKGINWEMCRQCEQIHDRLEAEGLNPQRILIDALREAVGEDTEVEEEAIMNETPEPQLRFIYERRYRRPNRNQVKLGDVRRYARLRRNRRRQLGQS